MNSRAQANIIIVVLLVLLGIAALVVVATVVMNFVKKESGDVGISHFTEPMDVEAKSMIMGGMQVQIDRSGGEAELSKLHFIFEDVNGETYESEIESDLPGILGTKTFYFSDADIGASAEIQKVSVTPFFGDLLGIRVDDDVKEEDMGLVSWWKFDGNLEDSFGENGGSCTVCPNLVSDVALFDGDDDSVSTRFDNPDSLTISLWVYPTAWTDVAGSGFPAHHVTSNDFGIGIATAEGGWITWIKDSIAGTRTHTNTDQNHNLNTWHFIALTYDKTSGEQNFYLDGLDPISASHTPGAPIDYSLSTNLLISYPTHATNGRIDNVMVFDRALSEDEVRAIYNQQNR